MFRRVATRTAMWVTIVMLSAAAMPARTGAAVAARTALGLAPGSELWMEGKSTIHDWECRTKTINVVFTRAGAQTDPIATKAIEALIRAKGIRGVDVQIPVASLHSDKKALDKNMRKAMQADKYPTIQFKMTRYAVVPPAASDTLNLRVEGSLTVHGVEKPITLDAKAWKGDKGEWLAGAAPLNMSDFGIKPPTMMLGRIKTRDRIVIHYRLLLAPDVGVASARNAPQR